MVSLVGYTGFVGSNLYSFGSFDKVYNSKNIETAYGTNPDILIYAGGRAEKFLANKFPEEDMELIYQAEENIRRINPKKLVLISTVDVFKTPQNVDEESVISTEDLCKYGYNRYQLELWTRENYPDALIVRLPALFGINIKKNFLYDFINRIPFMLSADKFNEIILKDAEISNYYHLQENGFYKANIQKKDKRILREKFTKIGFSSLNFTDSRSRYQYYNLAELWNDIQLALANDIKLLHLATEPVSAREIYIYLTGKDFRNEMDGSPANYNYKTVHYKLFGGSAGYIRNKEDLLKEIKGFVDEMN